MLSDIKIKKISVTELCHNDRLKIYVDPSKIYVYPGDHLNKIFSKTTASMVFKFHMQHDQA